VTNPLPLVPSFRMSGGMPPLSHVSSWHAEGLLPSVYEIIFVQYFSFSQ